jgi:hypothetical protein
LSPENLAYKQARGRALLFVDPNPTALMFGSAFEFFMSHAHLDRVAEDRTPAKAGAY